MNNPNCTKCLTYTKSLELIANRYSLIYTLSIFLSIFLSVLLLTKLIKNETFIIVIGLFSVIFAIIPLIYKEKIEKVHGYNSLAREFEILEQNFKNHGNIKNNFNKLTELIKKLADFPIDNYTKWRINRKNAKK